MRLGSRQRTSAPVGAPHKNPPPVDLEAVLADGLVLAHPDATPTRTLPLVLWRQRNRLNLDRLVAQASRRAERFSLGPSAPDLLFEV
jgi:hypothetical protein